MALMHKYVPRDPVHKTGRRWWYWDEAWGTRRGPFKTQHEARRAHDRYMRSL